MNIGVYVIICIFVAGISFYLGEKYGAKEVKKLEATISNLRLVINTQAKSLENKALSDIKNVNQGIQTDVTDIGKKL